MKQYNDPQDKEVVELRNLNQEVDDFDFGPIPFNTDVEDVPNDAIMSGYQYKILNNKLNMLLDLITSSSSTISPTNAPNTQEYMEKMFSVHEGQVKKYVANGLVEVKDAIYIAINSSASYVAKAQDILKKIIRFFRQSLLLLLQ